MQQLDFDLYNEPRFNLHIPSKIPDMTLYIMAILLFEQPVIICNIFAIVMCMILTWPLEWAKIKCKYASRKPMRDFLLMSIVIIVQSLTIYEIFAKQIKCKSLILKVNIRVKETCGMRLEMFHSIWVIFQNFSYLATYVYSYLDTNSTHTRTPTQTHTRTHTNTGGTLAMAKCEICNAFQICLKS